jgi:CubicO group peptidase (beta-lactamase class C family)
MSPGAVTWLSVRRWFATAAFFLAVFAHLHVAAADDPSADNFEGFLEPIRLHHNVPALAAILMHGDRVAGLGTIGYRKSGETNAVSREDLWHLGSIGKSMTATMMAQLVERGTLSWDLRVGKH